MNPKLVAAATDSFEAFQRESWRRPSTWGLRAGRNSTLSIWLRHLSMMVSPLKLLRVHLAGFTRWREEVSKISSKSTRKSDLAIEAVLQGAPAAQEGLGEGRAPLGPLSGGMGK